MMAMFQLFQTGTKLGRNSCKNPDFSSKTLKKRVKIDVFGALLGIKQVF